MPNTAKKRGISILERQMARGVEVITRESNALQALASSIDTSFCEAVDRLLLSRGSLIVIGIGKAGWIGQKLAATFASTGTPAHFVHPSEAVHGDLGRIGENDLVLVLSNSGKSEEIIRLLPHLQSHSSGIVAITANPLSPLAEGSDVVLLIPSHPEACSNGLAPTTSTASMMALGDALAMVVSDERGFASADFARFHPGGSLGQQLKTVDQLMRPIEECRISNVDCSIRQVLVNVARPGRRSGAVMLTAADGKLSGIFTDSDLARLLERRQDQSLDEPISQVMVRSFTAIHSGALASDAVIIMAQKKISELPVVDSSDNPIGLIDITDLIGLLDKDVLERPDSLEDTDPNPFPATIRLFS